MSFVYDKIINTCMPVLLVYVTSTEKDIKMDTTADIKDQITSCEALGKLKDVECKIESDIHTFLLYLNLYETFQIAIKSLPRPKNPKINI